MDHIQRPLVNHCSFRKINLIFISMSLLFIQNALLFVASLPGLSATSFIEAPSPETWTASNEDSWNYWWSYSGVSGPAYWGVINLDWFMCDKGRKQSPINIETKNLVYDPRLTRLKVDSNLISGVIYNDGHAIVLNCSTSAMLQAIQLQRQQQSSSNKNHDILSKNTTTLSSTTTINDRVPREIDSSIDGLFNERNDLSDSNNNRETATSVGVDGSLKELSNSIDLSISQSGAGSNDGLPGSASSLLDEWPSLMNNEQLTSAQKIQISGGGLPYSYQFEALYLRFGSEDNYSGGSEHQINSKSFPAEIQLMFFNSFLYKSYYEASSKPNGLVGISVLLDIAKESDPNGSNNNHNSNNANETPSADNEPLGALLKHVDQIKFRGDSNLVREFNLSGLMLDVEHFVSYEGSLTMPACHESVSWFLLNKPLYISQSKLNLLRLISADELSGSSSGLIIANNNRPPQPTNNRLIRTNIRPTVNKLQDPKACRRLWTKYDYRDSNQE